MAGEDRAEAAVSLEPGTTLLLYTDGLVERRSRSLEEGMNQLLAETAIHRDCAPVRLTDQIARALRDPESADDVCLLAARRREDRVS